MAYGVPVDESRLLTAVVSNTRLVYIKLTCGEIALKGHLHQGRYKRQKSKGIMAVVMVKYVYHFERSNAGIVIN